MCGFPSLEMDMNERLDLTIVARSNAVDCWIAQPAGGSAERSSFRAGRWAQSILIKGGYQEEGRKLRRLPLGQPPAGTPRNRLNTCDPWVLEPSRVSAFFTDRNPDAIRLSLIGQSDREARLRPSAMHRSRTFRGLRGRIWGKAAPLVCTSAPGPIAILPIAGSLFFDSAQVLRIVPAAYSMRAASLTSISGRASTDESDDFNRAKNGKTTYFFAVPLDSRSREPCLGTRTAPLGQFRAGSKNGNKRLQQSKPPETQP